MENRYFFQRLKNFGIRKIIKSLDFIGALFIFLLLMMSMPSKLQFIDKGLANTIINIAISLAALIIAAFSILVSFSDRRFVIFLKELDVYESILFLFEWNIYIALFTTMFGVLINYFVSSSLLYGLYIFLFIYMILSILNLVSFITYFGLRKGEFEEIKKK